MPTKATSRPRDDQSTKQPRIHRALSKASSCVLWVTQTANTVTTGRIKIDADPAGQTVRARIESEQDQGLVA